ncbi:class F sortase [Parafrankia sp. BMG5.11]|uniref:class F sortase n=1 Tax=Parafrankia sp. BMG5.11 TaxID=222540 RepID=UPI001FB3D4A6|nr:class F sortase [Parafrankia sp. BMG5.11]
MKRGATERSPVRMTFSRLLLVAGVVLVVGSGFRLTESDPAPPSDTERVDVAGLGTAIDQAGALDGTGAPTGPAAAAPVPVLPPVVVTDPTRVRIPAIGVDAAIVRLGLNADGSLAVPKKWQEVGWYDRGPAPGALGPSVLVGHYDSTSGPAVFYRLRALRAGDQIEVTSPTGLRTTFTVDRTEDTTKKAFPTDRVYGAVGRPELRLITCGGAFDEDTNHYLSNLIVYAHANSPSVPGAQPPGAGAPPAGAPAPAVPAPAVPTPVAPAPSPSPAVSAPAVSTPVAPAVSAPAVPAPVAPAPAIPVPVGVAPAAPVSVAPVPVTPATAMPAPAAPVPGAGAGAAPNAPAPPAPTG